MRFIRTNKNACFIGCLLLFCSQLFGVGDELFIEIDDALYWRSAGGQVEVDIGGSLDLEGYYFPQGPTGLIHPKDDENAIFRPRLTLTADGFFGDRLYAFGKLRWDDGYDPNYEAQKVRFDAYFVRLALVPQTLDLQVGKFATVFGNWTGRHESWENPLITAPLAYEEVTSVLDDGVLPSAAAFANLSNVPNNLKRWVPILWGAVYGQGAALFATHGKWDAAATITNRALSSRPNTWEDYDWSLPNWTGRLGYRATPAIHVGLSGSWGPYLKDATDTLLPANQSLSDFTQGTVGVDFSYARQKLEVWAEVIASRFEVPNAGHADVVSYYLETKYKLTHQLYLGARWSHQIYLPLETPNGDLDWDNDIFRAEIGLGYRLSRNIQFKAQYGYQHQDASFQNGENLLSTQLTIRF